VSHPIAIVLFTALLGAGAALATIPNRWCRIGAGLTMIVALAGGTVVSGDGWLLRRTAPLRWSSPHLTAIGAVRINGGGLALTASPNGRAFAVTQYPIGRRAQLPTSRYVIGQFGDSAQATRTSTAIKIAFIDDETLLALDSAGHDSLELRAERVGAAARGAVRVLWRERIAGMDSPQLLLDRAHRAWLVVGRGDGDESFVVVSDTVGGVHPHLRRLKGNTPDDVGEIMAQPLTAFADGSALWTSLPRFRGAADGLTPVLLAASLSPRWELRGIDDAGERFLADVEGFPTCAIELDSLGTLCVERSPNGSHVWRARSASSVERIADLPPTLDLVHAEGGGRVAAAERFGQRMMVVDVGTRQAFRLTLPGSSDRLLARWTADVAARSGYVLVLTTSRDGAVVTRYAIR
jgi:hypothetical protein